MRIDGFAAEVNRLLSLYSDEVNEKVNQEAEEVAKEGLEKIKQIGDYEDRTGKYRKGFYIRNKKKGSGYVLANKEYRLTHLLEKGRQTDHGTGRTQAHPHWEPTESYVIDEFTRRVEEVLSE